MTTETNADSKDVTFDIGPGATLRVMIQNQGLYNSFAHFVNSDDDIMEGPFGLISSRAFPRWPWSYSLYGSSNISEHTCNDDASHTSPVSGSRSTAGLNSQISAKLFTCMGRTRPHCNRNNDESSRTETETEFPSRDVENAVEQSGEGRSEFGSYRAFPPRGVVNRRSKDKDRLWACFPILRQFYKPRIAPKTTREPNAPMSYQERLKCRALWGGEDRPFELFLLNAPDCPDEIRSKLKYPHQIGHGSYQREAQTTQDAESSPARPESSQLQIIVTKTSPTFSEFVRKSDSPPGEAALRSLTPEGAHNSSKSPSAACTSRKGLSKSENPIETGPRSFKLVTTRGVQSSPETYARQNQSKPAFWSKSRVSKPQRRIVSRKARSDHLSSFRAQNRFHSPVKRDRTLSNRVSNPIRLRSALHGDAPEIQPEQEEPSNTTTNFRTGRKFGIPQDASKYTDPHPTDHRKRTEKLAESEDKGESPSPSVGSQNDRFDGTYRPVHPDGSSPQMDISETVTTFQAPAAYVKLTDLTPRKSCYQAPAYQENAEVVKADGSQTPAESSCSIPTNKSKPATSHIKLVDSKTRNSLLLKIPSSVEANTGPNLPSLEARVKLPNPSKSSEVPSSSNSYSEPHLRTYESADSIINVKSSCASSSSVNPVSPPPSVISLPLSLLRLKFKTDSCNIGRDSGKSSSRSADLAAPGGEKNRVDNMALDVLRELENQPVPRSPPRRRAYEVAIPTGVWKLKFIPNNCSPLFSPDYAARNHQSLSGFSTASSSFSKTASVDGGSDCEAQSRCF